VKLSHAIQSYVDSKNRSGYVFESGSKTLGAFLRRANDVELSQITTEVINSYLDESDDTPVGWQAKYGVLFHFLAYWSDRGVLFDAKMPAKKTAKATSAAYVYSRYQIHELLKATRSYRDPRNIVPNRTMHMLIVLIYATGMTTGEALRMRREDVDTDNQILTIVSNVTRQRTIPIGKSLADVLRNYLRWRTRTHLEGENLLVTKFGKAVLIHTASQHFEKLRKDAGIFRLDGGSFQPRLTDLRVAFAVHRITSWIRNKADLNRMLPALAAYMGQVALGSTEKYLALTSARFQKHLNILSPQSRRFHWGSDPSLMRFLDSL